MGAGSMPASVGTGAAQALGGILGNALARQMGGGTITGMQPTQPNPTYTADSTINNDAYMADPLASYDPTFSADLGY